MHRRNDFPIRCPPGQQQLFATEKPCGRGETGPAQPRCHTVAPAWAGPGSPLARADFPICPSQPFAGLLTEMVPCGERDRRPGNRVTFLKRYLVGMNRPMVHTLRRISTAALARGAETDPRRGPDKTWISLASAVGSGRSIPDSRGAGLSNSESSSRFPASGRIGPTPSRQALGSRP